MDILILVATGFAAIIVLGTAAAWLYDTIEARLGARPGLHARTTHGAWRAALHRSGRRRSGRRGVVMPRNVRSHV